MKILVTGGAGFIGSHFCEELLKEGHFVTVYDNLSLGRMEFINKFKDNPNFRFVHADLLELEILEQVLDHSYELVCHMSANSDIPKGVAHPEIDFQQGTIATFNVLETMRKAKIKQIIFASTSAVYGEANKMPTPEDYGPLLPISFYGASKLACEGLISSYAHNYGIQSWIFRFGNIIGENATHGAVLDFIRKLKKNPNELEILGNGKQAKPYIYVKDCVEGMLFGYKHLKEPLNYFNLSCEGSTDVTTIAKTLVETMGLANVTFSYTGEERGWRGDVPQVRLDGTKMQKLGWSPSCTSDEAVKLGIKKITEQFLSSPY